MKLKPLISLLMFTGFTVASAQDDSHWTLIAVSADVSTPNGLSVSVDIDTIRKIPPFRKAWIRYQYTQYQPLPSNAFRTKDASPSGLFLYEVALVYFNCAEDSDAVKEA